jgi:hypothetical protein
MRSDEIITLLRKKFPLPEFALMAEVAASTGGGATRYADALIMGLWPSRGLHLSGFEIKVSRGDWLRENKRPEKADEIGKFCDFWWLVAPDQSVCKPEELPRAWGLMNVVKGRLSIVKPAEKLECQAMPRNFLACLVRRVFEQSPAEHLLKEARAAGYKEGHDRATDHAKHQGQLASSRLDELQAKVREFESLSGISIHSWHMKANATALRTVIEGGTADRIADLKRLRTVANDAAAAVDRELSALEEIESQLAGKEAHDAA